jgi:glucans biosynthesis protein
MSTQTTRGTPHAETWDPDWGQHVQETEDQLDRRICGCHTPTGAACTLTSTHSSGRCRFHGGVPNTGAQPGNQNARTHGLYSRRLQRCGNHCAMWLHCPYAGDDVLALDKPDRPTCVYEQEEYAVITEELEENSTADPHFRQHLAILQILLNRAAHALSVQTLTEHTTVTGANYNMDTAKVGAALDAYLRIAREYRYQLALRNQMQRDQPAETPPPPRNLAQEMLPLLAKTEGMMEEVYEQSRRWNAFNRRMGRIPEGAPLREPDDFVPLEDLPHDGSPLLDDDGNPVDLSTLPPADFNRQETWFGVIAQERHEAARAARDP